MPADPEFLADRARIRRKLSFWRVVAILSLIVAVLAGGVATARRMGFGGTGGPQIARISIGGVITGDARTTELFRRVAREPAVAGVVLSINSPGGTTTGSEELFRGIRELSGKKPLVAFVDGTAASGAYIAAMAADHIVARETALVGSIGVLFQYPDLSGLLGRIGVGVDSVKSSPLKAEPSGFRPASPEAKAALQAIVNDTYDWFKGLVADRRKLQPTELATVSDGRIFSARQGVPLKLVDQLGSERDAIAWMEREKNIGKDLPVRNWKPRGSSDFTLWSAAAFGADLAGLERVAETLRRSEPVVNAASLEGLLALWQPQPLHQ